MKVLFLFKIYCLTAMLLLAQLCQGQSKKELAFFRISTAQGLSQSSVFCIHQDKQGFLWFGTAEGLNRYDGYNFKVYRHNFNDETSLIGNEIISITEDNQARLWIGTRTTGLSVFDPKTQKFDNNFGKNLGYHLNTGGVATITNDQNGHIWASTSTYGLLKINSATGQITKIAPRHKPELGLSAAIAVTKNMLLVANEKYEILVFENGKLQQTLQLKAVSGIKNGYISGLTKAPNGLIYVSTSTDGIYTLNTKSKEIKNVFYQKNTIGGVNNVKKVIIDKAGDLLAATDNGLIIFPQQNLNKAIHQEANSIKRYALSSKALLSIFEDKNSNIWIGTWEGGINVSYRQPSPFALVRQETGQINGPLERKITSVAATSNEIWLGSNSGLSRYNRSTEQWSHYNEHQLGGSDINALKIDHNGDLFISPYQGNLSVFFKKNNSLKQYNFKAVRNSGTSSISTFALEKTGKMWVGTYGSGLYVFDKKTGEFQPFQKPFEGHTNWPAISAILHDHRNRLWVGTSTSGLYQYNFETKKWKLFNAQVKASNNLSHDHILTISESKNGQIWVGTNGGGLNSFQEKTEKFRTITVEDGLPNNTIKSIVEDNSGQLWVSTNLGICMYNPSKGTFKTYSEADGLQGKEFGRNVGTKNSNGELFFGGTNGLSYFNPKKLQTPRNQIPKIVFSDFKLFNKSVEIGAKNSPLQKHISLSNEITLKNNQSVFTIEYAALDFQQLKNYQYAYMLEGFDKDWNEVENIRIANYTNLHEGKYIFRVRSTDNYGYWTKNDTTLTINILPPWYRTIWAYLLYLLMLAGALYFWRRIILIKEKLQTEAKIERIEAKKIRELDEAKTNFFTNISHEFRTPLTLIISPLQQLMQQKNDNLSKGEVEQKHGLILKNAQRLLRLINQILDISKIESGNLKLEITKNDIVEFLNSIALSFGPLAKSKDIDFQTNIKCKLRYVYFDRDILEKVTYNLLSNAFKFTNQNGRISFEASVHNNQLLLVVADSGIGMNAENLEHIFDRYYQANGRIERKTVGSGIGLALTKELVELHKGSIEVDSIENKGSAFTIKLPIGYENFDPVLIKENFDFEPKLELDKGANLPIPSTEIVLENDGPVLLIVEDNDELRDYLSSLFTNFYKVILAADGEQGLKMALEHMPDIIISDYIMPNKDGGQLCHSLKADERTSHIPFIMLTSRQAPQIIEKSYEFGADDYILKPFNSQNLVKKVGNILRSRRQLIAKLGTGTSLLNNITKHESSEQRFLNKITEIVEENIQDPAFDVSMLEDKLAMSKMQLYRKLKAISNLAPNELIRSIRLQKSVKLLSSQEMNVSEVAYAVGFNDPAYYARAFRKEYGKAPSDYLKD
jgi:signal transduction histidine kinase/ligand-binding sensor domain-containing protein/DNA-binding response OmpR family regulator